MGFQIDDAIIFIKLTSDFPDKKNLYTLGNPDSYLLAAELKYLIKDKFIKKINSNKLNSIYLKKLESMQNNRVVNFLFFIKLLNFKSYKSIDCNKNTNADYFFDLTKKIPNFLKNKSNFIYDTGTLPYVENPYKALEFVNLLLADNGIVYHKCSTNNNLFTDGYYQINESAFKNFYKNKYKILFTAYSVKRFNNIILNQFDKIKNFNIRTFLNFCVIKNNNYSYKNKEKYLIINFRIPFIYYIYRNFIRLFKNG